MTNVRIALCQIFVLDGDREGNFVRIENALREAKEGNADIACLPECCLYGWVNPAAHRRAHPIPGEDTDRLCALAKRYQIHLCAGLAEKEGNCLYDSSILIDDNGAILLIHRKMNLLTELMTPPYTPGSEIKTAETRFGRIGMLICADTFIDDYLQRMAAQKPDLLLVPYGWAEKEEAWPPHGEKLHSIIRHAAKTTGAPVIGTDSVGMITNGEWSGRIFGGQSAAADPAGNLLAVLRDRDRDVRVIELIV